MTEADLTPIIEALIYLAEEPVTESALVEILGKEHQELIHSVVLTLVEQYRTSQRGMEIKEIANGFKMATKPEYHEWVRKYVKQQNPPTKLSLAALETLAVIAYRQPVTVPEIQEVRGVSAVGVLKTLIDKKLVTTAGRKTVIGRPILYRTTKEFLLQFGLKSLEELPSLEEFEELAQAAFGTGVSESPTGMTAPHHLLSDMVKEGESVVFRDEQKEDQLVANETEIAHGFHSEATLEIETPASALSAAAPPEYIPEGDASSPVRLHEAEPCKKEDRIVFDPDIQE
jgi:segregation and condensation protein B